jgi:hypothetical protein
VRRSWPFPARPVQPRAGGLDPVRLCRGIARQVAAGGGEVRTGIRSTRPASTGTGCRWGLLRGSAWRGGWGVGDCRSNLVKVAIAGRAVMHSDRHRSPKDILS